jgi:ferredoxin
MTADIEVTSPALAGESDGPGLPNDPFVLESRGWSSPSVDCAAKIAALDSLLNLAEPAPVARVSYVSRGNLLVIEGEEPERARAAAQSLAPHLHVTLLSTAGDPASAHFATWAGRLRSLAGYLGEFAAEIEGLRTAQSPQPSAQPVPAKFDLVLDFTGRALPGMRQPPQGYFAAPRGAEALAGAIEELRESVGEFEKPKFFDYRANLCAHSRSSIEGCNACIEACSTGAIRSDGDHVAVDPHLCMGCGTCSTVCPSGAMGYQYPRPDDRGAQIKQLLATFRHAGGTDACVVFHDSMAGRDALARAAAAGPGLPARALPLAAWSVGAIGLDVLLSSVAFGASQVVMLSAVEDEVDVAALRGQMAIGQAILSALGYAGRHFELIRAGSAESIERSFAALAPAAGVAVPATFLLSNDKRTAIEFAVEHLAKHAPSRVDEIALPAGSPFGEIKVDAARCTMCMSCVGACPTSALMDGVDQPQLKFIERNCVQCGLCASTCPEDAIALAPRLLLTPAVREARVLNATQPFHCVRCQKPFGTKQMVDAMLGRLAGHSMFAGGAALKRLQMCADCRVVDMMESKEEVSVLKLGSGA